MRQVEGGFVTYFHLMFDRHEVIFSEGVPTESVFAGEAVLGGMDEAVRAEMRALFPDLPQSEKMHDATALQSLKPVEARVMLDL